VVLTDWLSIIATLSRTSLPAWTRVSWYKTRWIRNHLSC